MIGREKRVRYTSRVMHMRILGKSCGWPDREQSSTYPPYRPDSPFLQEFACDSCLNFRSSFNTLLLETDMFHQERGDRSSTKPMSQSRPLLQFRCLLKVATAISLCRKLYHWYPCMRSRYSFVISLSGHQPIRAQFKARLSLANALRQL